MYPQQYQEFLDFLDSNPEYLHDMRIRLLTPELIALPEQFAQLVTTVTDLAERFAAFVETTNKRLTAIEEDVATLKEDVGTLKEDVGTLKNDQATMKNDIASLKGSDLERQSREIILNIAKDELGLTKGHILLARGKNTAPAFAAAMTKAEEEGLVTEEQESDVMVADIIIGPDGPWTSSTSTPYSRSPAPSETTTSKEQETSSGCGRGNRRGNHRRRHRGEDPAATAGTGGGNQSPHHPASNVHAERRSAGGLTAPRQSCGHSYTDRLCSLSIRSTSGCTAVMMSSR